MSWSRVDLQWPWIVGTARWLRRLLRSWPLVTSALVAGAIVHILVTLSSAQFNEASSFRILTRDLPVNRPAFAPPVTAAAQPLAFFRADALYSYCHYETSAASVQLAATLHGAGWSLSLHTPKGQNFYYVAGSDTRQTDVRLVLAPPGNVFAHGATEVSDTAHAVPVIKLPTARGLAILRAPIKGLAYRRQVDELRASFNCTALVHARR